MSLHTRSDWCDLQSRLLFWGYTEHFVAVFLLVFEFLDLPFIRTADTVRTNLLPIRLLDSDLSVQIIPFVIRGLQGGS